MHIANHFVFMASSAISLLLGATLDAQNTTYVAPAGYGALSGHGGDVIPFWAGSGVYQQVHDASDLSLVFRAPVAVIKALSFRKDFGAAPNAARTVDMEITVGTTPVTARTASTTFANNLGLSPTLVLPYTNLSLPVIKQVSNPNPQGWFFPFATPFIYLMPIGNLCYELRFKNVATGGVWDTVNGSGVTFDERLGAGCIATGRTQPAAIGTHTLNMTTGAFVSLLFRGAASAPAVLCLGNTARRNRLPGFCSSLETLPLVTVAGSTDAAGVWTFSITVGSLYWAPRGRIFTQFGFLDAGLPNGLGLSDCAPMTLPPPGIARIWFGPASSGQGNETGTTGSRETYPYGLITGFDV